MMCAVLISVICSTSMADGSPARNWRFWSNPFYFVPNAPIITGTVFVLTFPYSIIIIIIIILEAWVRETTGRLRHRWKVDIKINFKGTKQSAIYVFLI